MGSGGRRLDEQTRRRDQTASKESSHRGNPELLAWYDSAVEKTAIETVAYEKGLSTEWLAKGGEYAKYIGEIAHNFYFNFRWYENPYTGLVVTYEVNLDTPKYTKILQVEFMKYWFKRRFVTPQFLRRNAKDGLADFLLERPDMIVLRSFLHFPTWMKYSSIAACPCKKQSGSHQRTTPRRAARISDSSHAAQSTRSFCSRAQGTQRENNRVRGRTFHAHCSGQSWKDVFNILTIFEAKAGGPEGMVQES